MPLAGIVAGRAARLDRHGRLIRTEDTAPAASFPRRA